MIAIDAGHPAMTMARVFAKADIRHDYEVGTSLLDVSTGFLDDPVLRVRAARFLILLRWDAKEQNRLQPEIARTCRFGHNIVQRELRNSRHARDRPRVLQFFTNEEGQDKVVCRKLRLAHE